MSYEKAVEEKLAPGQPVVVHVRHHGGTALWIIHEELVRNMRDRPCEQQEGPRKYRKQPPRPRLCHELGHFVLAEQKKLIDRGLPGKSMETLVNDWALEGARNHGYKVGDGDEEK